MNSSIRRAILASAFFILLITTGFLTMVWSFRTSQADRDALTYFTRSAASGTEKAGIAYLESLDVPYHMELFLSENSSVWNNGSSDANAFEDPEYIQAQEEGEGYNVRTVDGTTAAYAAVRLGDGSILRVSAPVTPYFWLLWPLILIGPLGYAVCLWISRRLSEALLEPINRIDPEHTSLEGAYPELHPLILRIRRQNDALLRSIQALKREHEARDRYRREFTANVSHELKTPLTSISGYAEIIRDGLVKQEDIPRFAGNIHREADRLITLVGDILRLSNLDEGIPDREKSRLDLYDLAEDVLDRLGSLAQSRGISLSLSGEHAEVYGSDVILEEMIHNLVDNAIKYNKPDGSVRVEIRRQEKSVELVVEDTGIGIPEEDQERVFERFYRVDKSHSRELGGTGLGLSIVKHAAASHRAQISLSSQVGKGTRIRVSFPL